jgi:hypothetical protein
LLEGFDRLEKSHLPRLRAGLIHAENRANQGFRQSDLLADESNARITKAHDRGTSTRSMLPMRSLADEPNDFHRMNIEDMNDLHLRIARVTEDLRKIQQELNCAAMQAPNDPELMEALNSLSETEPIETLRLALDQMRHFLWFYSQVMSNEPELGDQLRSSEAAKAQADENPKAGSSFLDKLSRVDELMLLRHLADWKLRKPN